MALSALSLTDQPLRARHRLGWLLLNTPGSKGCIHINYTILPGPGLALSLRIHWRNISSHGHDPGGIRGRGHHAAQRPGDALYFEPYQKRQEPGQHASQYEKAEHSSGGAAGISLLSCGGLSDPGGYRSGLLSGGQPTGSSRLGRPVLEEGQPTGSYGRPGLRLPALGLHRPSCPRWPKVMPGWAI